jgi:hypothetical protein
VGLIICQWLTAVEIVIGLVIASAAASLVVVHMALVVVAARLLIDKEERAMLGDKGRVVLASIVCVPGQGC